MKFGFKLILFFTMLSSSVIAQVKDSLSSRVSVSFSSGVAKGYVNGKMNFKDEVIVGKPKVYSKFSVEEILNKILSLKQSVSYHLMYVGDTSGHWHKHKAFVPFCVFCGSKKN